MSQQDFKGRTSTGDVEISTPAYIFLPLHAEFNFTFDLAASKLNAKCDKFFSKEDDALSRDWPLGSNWLNPPYSRSIGRWIRKAYLESRKGSTNVVLVNSNTESSWYHLIAVPYAHEIRHVRWRIAFIKNGVQQPGGYHPSCILVFKPDGTTVPKRNVSTVGPHFHFVTF